jgi:predicted GNAT family acetyltransferase
MKHDQQAGAPGTARFALADNPAQGRYELRAEGELAAWAEYRRDGDTMRFTHTEVQEAYEGQGLASRLASFALDDARRQGLRAVPDCPFMARYIERHAEYADLVAPR